MTPEPSASEFLHATLGRTGRRVFRLGLSASYRPGVPAVRAAIDAGVNYLFGYVWDSDMTRALREVPPLRRDEIVIATGATNLLGTWMLERAVHQCLKKFRVDTLDVFHCFWVGGGRLGPRTRDSLRRMKEQGKIRHIAISTHNRPYAAELVREGVLDVLMMRYNAAHRGAETDIFPHLAASGPGVVSYTATRWGKLLQRPKSWPADGPVPTAGDCYRFVLTNPHVHVCLTAPRTRAELDANLAEVARGPLDTERMEFMRRFGDAVHAGGRRFFR
jgi:aryl-alcohol dehydrogenase-like predicted oxidoreductase